MTKHPWTEADKERLRRLYPDATGQSVADSLGRPLRSVYTMAAALGLRKSEAFNTSDLSRRIQRGRQHPSMVASQIQTGAVPWNKGVKGSTGLHPNCKATQFKKGAMSGAAQHNYVPIGSLRVSKDGYLERKVTDDPALVPARRWVVEHRLVWQAANGPIPRGHIVVWRPGMKSTALRDITADRLECITRAENARRNHPNSHNPELAKLVQLKGAITRQVNRITREAQETHP